MWLPAKIKESTKLDLALEHGSEILDPNTSDAGHESSREPVVNALLCSLHTRRTDVWVKLRLGFISMPSTADRCPHLLITTSRPTLQ